MINDKGIPDGEVTRSCSPYNSTEKTDEDFFKFWDVSKSSSPSTSSNPSLNSLNDGLKDLDDLTDSWSIGWDESSWDEIIEWGGYGDEFDFCKPNDAMNNDNIFDESLLNDVSMLKHSDWGGSRKRKPTNKLLRPVKKKSKKMKTKQFVVETYDLVKRFYNIDEEYLQHDDIIEYILTFCNECSYPSTCSELTNNIIGIGDHNILYTKMDKFYRKNVKRSRENLPFIRLRLRKCKGSSETIFQSNEWLTLNEYLLNPTYKNEADGKYHYVVILDKLISHLYLFLRYCYKTINI